jgi:hypothetical protein
MHNFFYPHLFFGSICIACTGNPGLGYPYFLTSFLVVYVGAQQRCKFCPSCGFGLRPSAEANHIWQRFCQGSPPRRRRLKWHSLFNICRPGAHCAGYEASLNHTVICRQRCNCTATLIELRGESICATHNRRTMERRTIRCRIRCDCHSMAVSKMQRAGWQSEDTWGPHGGACGSTVKYIGE